jgi:hypothetical protein
MELDYTLLAIVAQFVAYFVLTSALAVWLGWGGQSFWLRCGVVAAWLALWMPTKVDDLGWLTLIEVALVGGVCGLVRSFASRGDEATPRVRFRLKDLLIATLVVGLLLWIALQFRHRYAPALVLAWVGLASASALSAAWLALGSGYRWARWLTFVVVHASAFACARLVPFLSDGLYELNNSWNAMSGQQTLLCTTIVIGHGLSLAALLASVRFAKFKVLNTLPVVLSGAPVLALAMWLFAFLVVPLTPPAESFPDPNHYPELRAFAISWQNVHVPSDGIDTEAVRRQFAVDHAGEIAMLRRLARGPSWVVLEYKENGFGDTFLLQTNPRLLIYLLEDAALGQPAAARAETGLDILHLGDRICNGGLFVDHLVASGFADRGARLVHKVIPELDADSCRALLPQLMQLESSREPIAPVRERDLIFSLSDGWASRAQLAGERLIGADSIAGIVKNLSDGQLRRLAWLRMLRIELALRLFHIENNRFPMTLAGLVPGTLPELPMDPFSEKSFLYRPDDDDYILYSVGPNRIDDGGVLEGMILEGDQMFGDPPE